MSGEMARAEVSPEGAAPGPGVELFEQATKALALRTPFEGDEVPPRNPTLPARLVSWSASEDYRKKHKKAPPPPDVAAAETPLEAVASRPAKAGLWNQFEAYFRPVTLDDLEMLRPKFPLSGSKVDSSLLIPFLGSREELVNEAQTFDVAVAETSSYLGVGGEEVISNRDHSDAHLIGQKERNSQATEQGIHDVVVQQMVSDKDLKRQSREHGMHEVSVQIGERPFEAYHAGRSSGAVSAQCTDEEGSSLNWLLGTNGRFVLTSERPNKKRKLLGVDAGLEQLVLLPRLGPEASLCCDVCCLGESSMESNRIVNCSKCNVSVHPKCYGLHDVPDRQWLCAWCTYLDSTGSSPTKDAGTTQPMPCVLCPRDKGALKPVKEESIQKAGVGHVKFAHLFCSLWSPEVYVEDMESMEPVTNFGNIEENRMKLTCSICKIKHGACVRCSHGTCRTPFHPICARESKHQMEIWGKYGQSNVELRAFCLKHSAVGFSNTLEDNNNASEQSPLGSMPNNSNIITGKIPKLRFTRKNKDKFMNCETDTSSSGNLIRVETVEQGALPRMVRNANSQPIRNWKTDAVRPPIVDHTRSSGDIAAVLRKLIDSGNVNVGDIACEVGISSESLEAALLGETTTFSHGLKLKIIKWLQTYEHIHADQGNNLKETSVVGQDEKPDGSIATQTVDVKSLMVPDEGKGALDVSSSAVIEPSLARSKCNKKILKDKNITCATGVTILQNGNMDTVKEGPNLECSTAGEPNFSPIVSKDVSMEEHGKLILNTTSGNKEFRTSMDIPNENQGALLEAKINCLSEAEPGSKLEEGVSSFGHSFSQGDKAETRMNSGENGTLNHDSDCFHGQLFFNFDDSQSYIHPFIKNKIAHILDASFKQDSEALCHHEQPSCGEISIESSLKLEETIERTAEDQVLNAKSLKILEQSPDDEVEGEIVYLQARLLDDAVVLKQRYEELLAKVVQNLSHELDAFSRRKWDLILVNQFLRDVREAKKRGRKEKRHKEARAVLAAAAVTSSSRNSTLRKDAKENVALANQEGSPKLAAGSSKVGPWTSSLPRAKDSSKLSNSKVSTENNLWGFHMPISSKENPLYCDICMRTETVLNRIFVCSRCKAAVHIDCYKNLDIAVGPWTCEFCEDILSEAATVSDGSGCNASKLPFAQCGMCHGTSGAFRKTTDGQWVHAFCAEWLLGTNYVRGQDNLVHGMESVEDGKDTCCVCLRNVGMCLRCNSGDCPVTFHPTCARNSGFYMDTKGFGATPQHKAYCGKHSVEQKEVDAQQYGPEELKTMKQMRVELEKLRLLCERIIKREKVKRETVFCDHDILARTKDTVVFTYLTSGASSESATTSVNNKSYSGTMQRSDDVTVDSTISGKKTVRFSLNSRDAERNSADSSRTLISFKRKLGERGSLAGKKLPQRPAIASQKLEDGGKKSKDKKGFFQKELIMTSDQASTQNQRLPKGYAYVPRDSLSKEKPWNRNVQSDNQQEPGG